MLHIGNHISSAKGFEAMGKHALKLKADTFGFFTRNPRGSRVKALDMEDIEKFVHLLQENGFAPIVAHAPYTLNPCAKEERVLSFAKLAMEEDLKRLEYIPGNYYNFHPGSHVGQGKEVGIQKIAQILNEVLFEGQKTKVLLETMAGKGSEVGSSFEEIREILDRVSRKQYMGVCLDTCHVWDAGYDIVAHLDEVLSEFDRVIGLSNLCAIHLNDSQNPMGSHKDRHAPIGKGYIGFEALSRITNHPALRHLPFILETPHEKDEEWALEIQTLREAWKE